MTPADMARLAVSHLDYLEVADVAEEAGEWELACWCRLWAGYSGYCQVEPNGWRIWTVRLTEAEEYDLVTLVPLARQVGFSRLVILPPSVHEVWYGWFWDAGGWRTRRNEFLPNGVPPEVRVALEDAAAEVVLKIVGCLT